MFKQKNSDFLSQIQHFLYLSFKKIMNLTYITYFG